MKTLNSSNSLPVEYVWGLFKIILIMLFWAPRILILTTCKIHTLNIHETIGFFSFYKMHMSYFQSKYNTPTK